MRRTWSVSALLLAIELFAVMQGRAQGTMFLSGLDRPTTGSLAVGNYWVAAPFHTGDWPAGYTLNSIQLSMGQPTGSPSNFTVMIWDYYPPKPLTVLSGTAPSTEGVFAYSASGFTLAPSTDYMVAVTSVTPVEEGSYRWNYTAANPVAIGHWNAASIYLFSATGTRWDRVVGATPQFAVNATPIPEPSALALLISGGGLLWAGRCRRLRRRSQPNETCQTMD